MCLDKKQLNLFNGFILDYISNELRIESVSTKKDELVVTVSSDDEQTMCHEMAITKSLFDKHFEDGYEIETNCIGGDDEHNYILCSIRISKIGTTNI